MRAWGELFSGQHFVQLQPFEHHQVNLLWLLAFYRHKLPDKNCQVCWSLSRAEGSRNGKNLDHHGVCGRWGPKHGGEAAEGIEAVFAGIWHSELVCSDCSGTPIHTQEEDSPQRLENAEHICHLHQADQDWRFWNLEVVVAHFGPSYDGDRHSSLSVARNLQETALQQQVRHVELRYHYQFLTAG